MQTFFRLYYALNLLGAFTSIAICLQLWKRRYTRLGTGSFIMMLTISLWLVPNVLLWLVEGLPASIAILKLGFLGALFTPPAWFIYTLYFVGKESWASVRLMRALGAASLFLFILVLADQYWTEITLVQQDWVSYLLVHYSPWLGVATVYSYILIGFSIILIIHAVVRRPNLYRRRGPMLLIGVLVPLAANIIFQFNLLPDLRLDFTPLGLLFSGLILIWGGVRYQLFELVPVARDALVDRLVDGMVVVDDAGRVLDLNPAAQRTLGMPLSQARLAPLAKLLPQAAPLVQQLSSLSAVKMELAVDRGGQILQYEAALNPILNHEGLLAGGLVVLHDITGHKQAERQLEEALSKEKALVESKSRFVAVVSHALRTPLTAIQSSAQLLETYFDRLSEQKRRDHLTRIRESVTGLDALLKRMSVFEAMQSGKIKAFPVDVDLVALCQQAVRDLTREDERPSLRFEKHGQDFSASQDRDLLYQVLTNLLSNAFKYSPPDRTVKLSLWVEGLTARIEVLDEGIGIPAADLPHLGEAFFRASNAGHLPGSGLGLLIAVQALELIDGNLQIESIEGKGTLARVTFPLRLSAPAES